MVRVEIQPDKLDGYGIALEDVRAAIGAANADGAKGLIDRAASALRSLERPDQQGRTYRDLVVTYATARRCS